MKHVANRREHELQKAVHENAEAGAELFTDSLFSSEGLAPEFIHGFVNHAEKYVDGRVHTNGLENFWSLLKRN